MFCESNSQYIYIYIYTSERSEGAPALTDKLEDIIGGSLRFGVGARACRSAIALAGFELSHCFACGDGDLEEFLAVLQTF